MNLTKNHIALSCLSMLLGVTMVLLPAVLINPTLLADGSGSGSSSNGGNPIDALEAKLDVVQVDIDNINNTLVGIQNQLSLLAVLVQGQDALEAKLDDLGLDVDMIEAKLDELVPQQDFCQYSLDIDCPALGLRASDVICVPCQGSCDSNIACFGESCEFTATVLSECADACEGTSIEELGLQCSQIVVNRFCQYLVAGLEGECRNTGLREGDAVCVPCEEACEFEAFFCSTEGCSFQLILNSECNAVCDGIPIEDLGELGISCEPGG